MPYINPEFRERNAPVALLPGRVEQPAPIEVRARNVAPPHSRSSNHHVAFCAVLAVPVAFAILAFALGDARLCAILCLVGLAIGLIGLFALDGPP